MKRQFKELSKHVVEYAKRDHNIRAGDDEVAGRWPLTLEVETRSH